MAILLDHLLHVVHVGDRMPLAARAALVLRRLASGRRTNLLLRAGLMTLAGAALLAGGLSLAATMLASRHADIAARAAPPVSTAWSEVIHPIALYDLSGTDFAKLPRSYRARRRTPDGAREDVMGFGALGQDKPYLRIALLRHGDAASGADADSLSDSLARSAAADGETVSQIRPLPTIETRFGRIERDDLLLWDRGTSSACVGFRGLPDGGHVLQIAGFGCSASGRPLPAETLACAVDRIDLVSAGDDRALRAVFVAAERRPGAASCGGGALAAVDPQPTPGPFEALRQRAAWLDAGSAALPLRGPLAATEDER